MKIDSALRAAMGSEQRRFKRRVFPRISSEVNSRAQRFTTQVSSAVRPDYREASDLLEKYIRKKISAVDLCKGINKHARPVPWALQVHHRGRSKAQFTYEADDSGALDAWRELAILLGTGLAIDRFGICRYEPCGALFYDASPRGDRTTCSTKHKNAVASQNSRERERHQYAP